VHASVPYTHAEGIQNEYLKNGKTDSHAEHENKELMYMLRVRISSLRACLACTPVPDSCAFKGLSMCKRNSVFSIIFKVTKAAKKITKYLLSRESREKKTKCG
jgi:hypothetical protein